jgi:DNA-binding beta-propeller fold protein YncE
MKLKLILTRVWLVVLAVLSSPVGAQAAGNVYVANQGSLQVSQYAIGSAGLLSPLIPPTVAAQEDPRAIAITPDGKSLYVTNFFAGTISQYDIDPAAGALSPKTPATVAAGLRPGSIAVTPDGRSAYVTDILDLNNIFGGGRIFQYDIDPVSGVLSPKTPPTIAAPVTPNSITVAPDGRSAYAANPFADTVSQYDIDPVSGVLSPKTPARITARAEPLAVAVAPDGRSAYVTAFDDEIVSQYDIDPVSGVLSPKTPATVPGARSGAIAGGIVTPDGRSLYVPNPLDGTVSQYDIDPVSGVLSPKSPATVATPRANAIAVTPDGSSAYATNSEPGTVSQYDIDPVTGVLSPKTPATVPAGQAPAGIAVRPPPRVPTSKEQCKNDGWRNFPQFKNRGQCIAFVNHGP